MKILVIGCGKMGSVIAWDLCQYEDVESVGLVDNYSPSLERAAAWIQDKRVTTHLLGNNYSEQLIELMKYMVTWCWDQVIDSAMGKTRILKDGTYKYADAMSEYERFTFREFGKDLELEAFITPGMESFNFTRPKLKSCYEKTIRWPGYRERMSFLISCGVLYPRH